jgi:two-component system CheB/CheR fusion protein
LDGGHWNLPELRKLLEGIVPGGAAFENFEVQCEFPGAGNRQLRLSGRRISGTDRRPAQILLAMDEVEE